MQHLPRFYLSYSIHPSLHRLADCMLLRFESINPARCDARPTAAPSRTPLTLPPSRATALLSEIISGITLYFDKALGNNLLYRFERAQYVEQRRANPDKQMSEIYGAEHLLRLFGTSR